MAEQIAKWIWDQEQLDSDESWQGMMIEDAIESIEKLLKVKGEQK